MDILEFIEKTNKAGTTGELFELLERVMAYYGFDRVLFSLMTDHIALDQEAGHGIMRNYPSDWMDHYADKDYEDVDPVRQYVLQAPIPFAWDALEKTITLSAEQKKCMNEAREAGLHNGIAIPMRGPFGEMAGIGAASSVEHTEMSPDQMSFLNAACQQFYVAYSKLEQKSGEKQDAGISLTHREQEILKWCAQGKTTWEIGVILNLSEAGVLFHLRNVMKKFNTSSRVYAVMQAVRMGLIQL